MFIYTRFVYVFECVCVCVCVCVYVCVCVCVSVCVCACVRVHMYPHIHIHSLLYIVYVTNITLYTFIYKKNTHYTIVLFTANQHINDNKHIN